MRVRRVSFKLGSMRKPADWVVYPASKTESRGTFLVQSDKRIAEINPETGKAILSASKSNGAYFMHLSRLLGATEVDVPADVIALVRDAQPKSGDEIGPGVYVG